MLQRTALGFGALAMHDIARAASNPLAARIPGMVPRAKRVIFLFMQGGPSQLDLFDTKDFIERKHGQKIDSPLRKEVTQVGTDQFLALKAMAPVKPRGQSGMMISDLMPHLASVADDICLLRGMNADNPQHAGATLQFHTGTFAEVRPSMGAWVSYGLGTENANLPSFMVIAPALPYAGAQVWSADFLPGCHQGTRVVPGAEPVPNINRRVADSELQEMELGLGAAFNQKHLLARGNDPQLAARIKSFETAFGMQAAAPEAFDLSKETDATLNLYGLPRGSTKGFAWQCLIARRLAERGVRFIQLYHKDWDHHGGVKQGVEFKAEGIYLPAIDLWLDPRVPVPSAWLSHAHSDHARGLHQTVIDRKSTRLNSSHRT